MEVEVGGSRQYVGVGLTIYVPCDCTADTAWYALCLFAAATVTLKSEAIETITPIAVGVLVTIV